MERWHGKVALVTGVSAGIGHNIAENLTKQGFQVVGVARRVEKIQELSERLEGAPGRLHPLKCDLANTEEILNVFKWIKDNLNEPIHVLVNNAATISPGPVVDMKTEDMHRTLDVNVTATALFSREFLRQALDNKIDYGHLFLINSIAGLYVPKTSESMFNLYPPTKFALTALAEVLRQELIQLKSKIKITSIHPGAVDTEGSRRALDPDDIPVILKDQDVSDCLLYALGTPPDVQIQQIVIRPVGETL